MREVKQIPLIEQTELYLTATKARIRELFSAGPKAPSFVVGAPGGEGGFSAAHQGRERDT